MKSDCKHFHFNLKLENLEAEMLSNIPKTNLIHKCHTRYPATDFIVVTRKINNCIDMEYFIWPCRVSHAIGFNYRRKADRSARVVRSWPVNWNGPSHALVAPRSRCPSHNTTQTVTAPKSTFLRHSEILHLTRIQFKTAAASVLAPFAVLDSILLKRETDERAAYSLLVKLKWNSQWSCTDFLAQLSKVVIHLLNRNIELIK